MDRRRYLEGLGAAVAAGTLAGCTGNENENGNGTEADDGDTGDSADSGSSSDTEYGILSTSVTDQPNDIGDFESLVITIQGIWIKPAAGDDDTNEDAGGDEETAGETDVKDSDETDAEDAGDRTASNAEESEQNGDSDTDGDGEANTDDDGEAVDQGAGRYYIEFEEPQDADLVDLQGGETELIDETEQEVGTYQFLQLDVSETNGVLEGGDAAEVETPGNAPLQFKHAFEIRSGERTRFIADFAPFRRGNGIYLIRPVASGTQVLYGDEAYDGGDGDSASENDDGADDDTTDGSENRPESAGRGGN